MLKGLSHTIYSQNMKLEKYFNKTCTLTYLTCWANVLDCIPTKAATEPNTIIVPDNRFVAKPKE